MKRIAVLMLALSIVLIGTAGPSRAANYVLQGPTSIAGSTVIASNGTTYTADSAGRITITNAGLIPDFIRQGWLLLPYDGRVIKVDLAAATTPDVTLTAAQAMGNFLWVTNGGGAGTVSIPRASLIGGHRYMVFNNSGYTLTFKAAGSTGGTIANGKRAVYTSDPNGLWATPDLYEVWEQS